MGHDDSYLNACAVCYDKLICILIFKILAKKYKMNIKRCVKISLRHKTIVNAAASVEKLADFHLEIVIKPSLCPVMLRW